jgi:rubrerythrin
MKLEEAIQTAIEYETKVRDLYKEATASAADDVGKRIFGLLEKEEQEHLDYLNSRLDEWRKSGSIVVEKLETHVPSPEAIKKGVASLNEKMGERKDRTAELEMLKRAHAAETETSAFYQKMVGELDADGQRLFQRFVEIEQGHDAIVQAQIDSLTGMGFWFDCMEFSLEAG